MPYVGTAGCRGWGWARPFLFLLGSKNVPAAQDLLTGLSACRASRSPLLSSPKLSLCYNLLSLFSAWQEIANAEDAFGRWWCVPDSIHLTGPPADPGGRAGTGCAGVQSPEEAAAAGSDARTATRQLFSEKAPDLSMTRRPRGPVPWKLT